LRGPQFLGTSTSWNCVGRTGLKTKGPDPRYVNIKSYVEQVKTHTTDWFMSLATNTFSYPVL
jgi:hypothetical protein